MQKDLYTRCARGVLQKKTEGRIVVAGRLRERLVFLSYFIKLTYSLAIINTRLFGAPSGRHS